MKYAIIGLTALAGVALTGVAPANAQVPCAPLDDVVNQLYEEYGEVVIGAGVSVHGHMVAVMANETNGTFTIILVMPSENGKIACVADAGTNWQSADDPDFLMPTLFHGIRVSI